MWVRHVRKMVAALSGAVVISTLLLPVATVSAAGLPLVPPVLPRTPKTVTADPLPTAQIDGVVYTQVVAGRTVFAGGSFAHARPAGAAPGVDEVVRSNLMAYDVVTGDMTSFAPQLDGTVKALALSEDGKTLYVGGQFMTVGSSARHRFAAFEVANGKLKSLAPDFNSEVDALATTGSTVYAGGNFTVVSGRTRIRLAAISSSKKALTAWAPSADLAVHAMTLTPDRSGLVVGGSFSQLSGKKAPGMGLLSAKDAKVRTWKINTVVRNTGLSSAILSLTSDKDTVYGTGFAYGGGNFEGAFAASPKDGTIRWLQDCHGDTYSVVPVGEVVYTVGHPHFCGNIGGFPDTSPKTYYRALAVTKAPGGRVAANTELGPHYGSFPGQPAPSLVNWFPDLAAGTYTGATQAAWSVTAAKGYLLLGGEFPAVGGLKQQGLVRFALPSVAPRAQGPVLQGTDTAPTASSTLSGSVDVSWPMNYDRDDLKLTYVLLRDGAPVTTVVSSAPFWLRSRLQYTDAGLEAGRTYRYQVRVEDGDANTVLSPAVAVQVASPPATPNPSESPSPSASPSATPSR